MSYSLAIVGSRGIPNRYGGFEQFAEFLSVGLAKRGRSVTVYNTDSHPYKEDHLSGVRIVRKWCPEDRIGAFGHFVYDYLSLRDAIAREVDVVLELGYGTSAVSMRICRRGNSKIVTNMDGLEWKRDKWSRATKAVTRWLEEVGANQSDYLVADNPGIREYLLEKYGRDSTMIPYGAETFEDKNPALLKRWNLTPNGYFLIIARIEPENNVSTILDGYVASGSQIPFAVIGSTNTKYGKQLKERFRDASVLFLEGIYDNDALNNLRSFSRMYFHGHSVGGTNPSLLEAMGAGALVAAHANIFNASVLGDDGYFFSSPDDVSRLIKEHGAGVERETRYRSNNLEKVRELYSWDRIVDSYDQLFLKVVADRGA
jgi:glycosyltransferase involved in cell wall biosynthesis